jgi:iron-sulfur cluster assembly protein
MVQETSTMAPVSFTEGAVKELLKLRDQQEIGEDFGLRIGVEGGGCSGLNYILGFDQKKQGDSEFFIDESGSRYVFGRNAN